MIPCRLSTSIVHRLHDRGSGVLHTAQLAARLPAIDQPELRLRAAPLRLSGSCRDLVPIWAAGLAADGSGRVYTYERTRWLDAAVITPVSP